MDDEEKNKNLDGTSEEEKKLEEEAQQEVGDEEIRAKVAEDLGLDPEDEDSTELLDKIVEREKSHHEKLSGAIKQKISYREKYQKASEEPKGTPGKGETPNEDGEPDLDKLVDQKLNERLEARELDSLDLSDEIKEEVRELSKLKGISVREAAKHPYILSRVEEAEKEERIKKATPKRSKGSYTPSYDPAKPLNPEDFDFDSEDGIKAWQEARKARDKHLAQNS